MNGRRNTPEVGRELLARIKRGAGHAGPPVCLLVGQPPRAILRPVATNPGWVDAGDVRNLTEWRNRYVRSFLTEFVATEERTRRWLEEAVGPDPTRILFMADAPDGRTFGYLGLAFIDWNEGRGEADAIVRGGEAGRGTMRQALETLLDWARFGLGLSRLGVRVRSDNPALEFYRKMGFRERTRVPLRRADESGMTVWTEEPGGAGELSLVHLDWDAGTETTRL